VFLQIRRIGAFRINFVIIPIENPVGQAVFLSKLTLFSQGNNVVDSSPSNIDGIISRDKYVSSTQLNKPIWNKMCVVNFEIPVWQPVFLSKTN
jgi:hypothetical protein